jgi:hypothetical protein
MPIFSAPCLWVEIFKLVDTGFLPQLNSGIVRGPTDEMGGDRRCHQ